MEETTWKSKHFLVLLYPDNPEHIQTFFLLRSKYNCAYISHDKDVFDEEDLVEHPDKELGAPKKHIGTLWSHFRIKSIILHLQRKSNSKQDG